MDISTVTVHFNGVDVTARVTVHENNVSLPLASLSDLAGEGQHLHSLRVTVRDRVGNLAVAQVAPNTSEGAGAFHEFLANWVRGNRQGVIADMAQGSTKYFHPLYKYISTMEASKANKFLLSVDSTLYYMDYADNADDLAPEPPNPETVRVRYKLTFGPDGGIGAGEWTDETHRPDYLLGPLEPTSPGWGGVQRQSVREVVNHQ